MEEEQTVYWYDLILCFLFPLLQKILCPDILYEEVVEVRERVLPRQDASSAEITAEQWKVKQGLTGEELLVMKEVDEVKLRHDLKQILKKGITSLAVVLLHSYM